MLWKLSSIVCVAALLPLQAGASSLQDSAPHVEQLGGGNQGAVGTPWLYPEGQPATGGAFSVALDSATPDAFGRLYFSTSSLELPLVDYGATAWPGFPLLQQDFWTDAQGKVSGLVPVPEVDIALQGLEFYAQAVVADSSAPLGGAFSDGLLVGFGGAGESVFAGSVYLSYFNDTDIEFHDMDLDGVLDLVSVGPSSNKAQILYGDGQDGFIHKGNPTVGQSPIDVAVGDINGDARPDLVAACSGDICIVESVGIGGWATWKSIHATGSPLEVELADLDSDGLLDLIYWGSAYFYTRRGLGDGAFGDEVAWQPNPDEKLVGPASLVDFNDDGLEDVMAVFGGKQLGIFENLGAGSFSVQPIILPAGDLLGISGGWAVDDFAWSDADQDGFIDVVCSLTKSVPTGPSTSQTFYALTTIEVSHAGAELSQSMLLTEGGASELNLVDVNADGLDDVVYLESGQIRVVERTPTFFFELSGNASSLKSGGSYLIAVPEKAALDFPLLVSNGAGDPEFGLVGYDYPTGVAAQLQSLSVSGLWGLGSVTNSAPVAMDLDDDGREDVVLPLNGSTWLASATGEWTEVVSNGIGFANRGVLPAKLTATGVPGVSGLSYTNGDSHSILETWKSNGDGTFSSDSVLQLPVEDPHGWVRVQANDDGLEDLALISQPMVGGPSRLSVFLADGAGGFVLHQSIDLGFIYSQVFGRVLGAHSSNSVREDIVIESNGLRIYRSNSAGDYALSVEPPGNFIDCAVGDLNGDSLDEVVGLSLDISLDVWSITKLVGGGVVDVSSYAIDFEPYAFGSEAHLVDLNGDGLEDMVRVGGFIDVFWQSEGGRFDTGASYPLLGGSSQVKLNSMDWDFDGDLDLVLSSLTSEFGPFGTWDIYGSGSVLFNRSVNVGEESAP